MLITDSTLIAGMGAGLALAITLPFYRRQRKLERATAEHEALALRYGLNEPVSLHPVVDPDECIGIGACVAACPEEDVLGLRNGQAKVVSPARCIGHGLCERACPVEAIQLVFGSETRGVEIPRVKANFETNVPGLYIVGELGGMGLIRNAFEQGRQCVEGFAKEAKGARETKDVLDVVIVGCGPAGLSTALNCQHHGLRFAVLEKEDVGGTVRNYPRKKIVMTSPVVVPGFGKLVFKEIVKERLIDLWEDIIRRTGLRVNTGETVAGIERGRDGCFTVTGNGGTYRARRVVLAIGRRGVPRKLGVPGEELPKVIYSLREPEAYQRDRILVVGGGDSAIEAALALAELPENQVSIAYRGERFSRIKPGNLSRIDEAAARRRVEILWNTTVAEITPGDVLVKTTNGTGARLGNDLVAVFAGGELPTKFLEKCGVQVDVKFGEP
jgi:thioredoxin reductase/NAD-dependent dihydropyrimidine dehydrogenase PreA subunit